MDMMSDNVLMPAPAPPLLPLNSPEEIRETKAEMSPASLSPVSSSSLSFDKGSSPGYSMGWKSPQLHTRDSPVMILPEYDNTMPETDVNVTDKCPTRSTPFYMFRADTKEPAKCSLSAVCKKNKKTLKPLRPKRLKPTLSAFVGHDIEEMEADVQRGLRSYEKQEDFCALSKYFSKSQKKFNNTLTPLTPLQLAGFTLHPNNPVVPLVASTSTSTTAAKEPVRNNNVGNSSFIVPPSGSNNVGCGKISLILKKNKAASDVWDVVKPVTTASTTKPKGQRGRTGRPSKGPQGNRNFNLH